jgi:NitT/TauT family transport system substrate-binding protein
MSTIRTRRRFLTFLGIVGATGLVRMPQLFAAEEAPETKSVRFTKKSGICIAPQYVAEELLRVEGFSEIVYVDWPARETPAKALADGRVDFTLSFAANHILAADAGAAMTMLAGVHVGCYELFVRESIRGVAELKGRSVGLEAAPPALLTPIAAEVGLDAAKDFAWIIGPSVKPLDLFAEGKIDAFLAFPPEPQELRARHVGHAILSTTVDRPWSQYFCCMLGGNRGYVQKHPAATKRVLRAVLKAADLCATDPTGTARRLVDRGFTPRYDYALQTLSELPYDKWREYDPEDAVRFYALRLREAGLIKSTPQKIITENTDWRFLNELKRELKA